MPVKAAMATIVKLESDWVIQWLIELTEILAPPFEGEKRGLAFAPLLREIGGLDVPNDAVRKVNARRKGIGTGSSVMLAAHLDTVFTKDVDATLERDGYRFTDPGIGDNSCGLVSLCWLPGRWNGMLFTPNGTSCWSGQSVRKAPANRSRKAFQIRL